MHLGGYCGEPPCPIQWPRWVFPVTPEVESSPAFKNDMHRGVEFDQMQMLVAMICPCSILLLFTTNNTLGLWD